MEKGRGFEDRQAVGRALAIFAFIFVIVVGIFGSLFLARSIPGLFGGAASAITSIFVSDEPNAENGSSAPAPQSLTLSTSLATVEHGGTVILSWNHSGKTTDGAYTFRYECTSGISFASPAAVACDTPLTLAENQNSIVLTARSTATEDRSATLRVDFVPEGSSVASISGSIPVTVKKPVSTQPTSGTGTTVTYPTTAPSDPNGHVDLSVRVVAVGIVNKNSGVFYAVQNPSRSSINDSIAIRFEIKNNGTKTSPQWYFRANLPTAQSYTFNSQSQNALRPGESIIYTLAFDGFINTNSGSATVTVDPGNLVAESNENNNYVIQTINTIP